MTWHPKPVFVYGTLKNGQPNFGLMQSPMSQSRAVFLGIGVTFDRWPLIVYEPFNTPFLLDCKGTGKHVVGELYQAHPDVVALLDDFEGHPNVYTRDIIHVKLTEANVNVLDAKPPHSVGDVVECEAYFVRDFRQELLATETFIENYADSADCRCKYVLHKDRPPGVRSTVLVKNA